MLLKMLTRMAKGVMDSKISRPFISPFASYYQIDVEEAEKELAAYQNLNEFFTRRLAPGSRAIDDKPDSLISPVDGVISEHGTIEQGSLIQAKNIPYSLVDLLGKDKQQAKHFENGTFMTIYLSPQNYHRIHSPFSGTIEGYAYLPGSLFPVNKLGVSYVPGLFARNERWITYIQTAYGRIALVKVGAFMVGSVQVLYDEQPNDKKLKNKYHAYQNQDLTLDKGEEIGFFQFGSTVICLFEPDMVEFSPQINKDVAVKMGQSIGKLLR